MATQTGVLTFDWSNFFPRPAARCTLTMALLLIAGIASGHAVQGMEAAAGAFSVGFGSFHELHKSRVMPMLYASVGMCFSSWIGTLAGNSVVGIVLAATFAGIAYATLSALSPGISYIGLQCVVWMIISSAYPATGTKALQRGLLVLAGGLLQTVVVTTLWRIERNVTPIAGGASQDDADPLHIIRQALSTNRQIVLYTLRSALTLAFAAALWHWRGFQNGYWIPMTAIIVMKPDFGQTVQRGIARILGTSVGAGLATVVVIKFVPTPWMLAALVTFFAWLAYSLLYVNYASYAICLTAYVVFLLTFAGLPGIQVVRLRTVNTALGGSIALLFTLPFLLLHQRAQLAAATKAP